MRCPCCSCENLAGADHCENCCTCIAHEDTPLALARTDVEIDLHTATVASLKPSLPACVPETDSLSDAIAGMRALRVGCLLVTSGCGNLVGILSERDLLYKVAGLGLELESTPVDRIMTRNPDTARLDHPLGHALYLMMAGDYRHLPIVDNAGRPTGIISSRDIIEYLESHFQEIVSLQERARSIATGDTQV